MAANFGKNYKISLFGESHGVALGIFRIYKRGNEKESTGKVKTYNAENRKR